MKKLSLLLVALAFAVTASAAVNFNGRALPKMKPELRSEKFMDKSNFGHTRMNLISEQPAGELKTYIRSGQAIVYSYYYGVYNTEQEGKTYIVYAEDGHTVYIKDIVYGLDYDSWVEGTIDESGEFITVPMDQELYWSDTYQAYIRLCWGSTYTYDVDGDTYIGFERDDRTTEAYFMIDGDNLTLVGGNGEDIDATGLTAYWEDDDSWTGCLDWDTQLTLTENYVPHEVMYDQPEGQLMTYTRTGGYIYYGWGYSIGETSNKVNLVWGPDRTVYMQDPMLQISTGAWIKGEIDPTYSYVSFPVGQYIYDNVDAEYGAIVVWSTFDVDEEGYVDYAIDERTSEIIYAFDAEDGTLTLVGSQGNPEFDEDGYLICPASFEGPMLVYSDDLSFIEIDYNVVAKELHLVPAIPADPTADEWYDCGDESGFSKFYFTLPTTDIDGNPLDMEYLSYSVYTDNDQLFTFTGEDYTFDLNEGDEYTEIPYWLWSDAVDFRDYFIYMYRTNAEGYEPLFNHQIGIQVHYTVDGVKNSSNIVYLEVFPDTKVNEINAGKTIANVRYFNVAGQEMAQPEGMTIQVTTYTDGTTSAVKVVK